jgi:hypothetical protein
MFPGAAAEITSHNLIFDVLDPVVFNIPLTALFSVYGPSFPACPSAAL